MVDRQGRAVLDRRRSRCLGRPAGVGGLAGFVLGLVAGAAVFFSLAWLLGMLSSDDTQWLDRAVGGALGGAVGWAVRFCGATPSKAL